MRGESLAERVYPREVFAPDLMIQLDIFHRHGVNFWTESHELLYLDYTITALLLGDGAL